MNISHTQIAKLLEDAQDAAEHTTNGLLDRDEFPILIRQLLAVTRQLLGEVEQLKSERVQGMAPSIPSRKIAGEFSLPDIPEDARGMATIPAGSLRFDTLRRFSSGYPHETDIHLDDAELADSAQFFG